jgi:hypothetical protein
MGTKPIRKRGLLVKAGEKLYSLTPVGRELARSLSSDLGTSGGERLPLARDIQARLEQLLRSKAVAKFERGEEEAVNFHDACMFWGITPRSSALEMEGRLADVEGVITAAESALSRGSGTLTTGGEQVAIGTTDFLRAVHGKMKELFAKELTTIAARRDERRQ